MTRNVTAKKLVIAGCILTAPFSPSYAIDSVSIEAASGNKTQMLRVGTQWNWSRQWWKTNSSHNIGGYWDLTIAHWRGRRFQDVLGGAQNFTSIGITPVFRLQKNSLRGLYAEAGIGAHYLFEPYTANNRGLSTKFQFGDHIAIGYIFQNDLDVSLKVQHFSNGGVEHPNDGINFGVVRLSYPF